MAQENEAQDPQKNGEHEKFPDTVWDEYRGQYVAVQLREPYIGITRPGQPAKVETDQGLQFLNLPLLVGIFDVKKDARGMVRITMLTRDPDESKAQEGAQVRIDMPQEMIGPISVTSPPKSPIVTE